MDASTVSKTRHLLESSRVCAALFASALNAVSKALAALAGLMLLVIVGVVFVGVFCRYALHMGLGWTEEAARFLLIGLTFVAATVAVDRWSHFQLAIASSWLPPRYQRPLQLFATFIVLITSAALVRYGVDAARISWNQTSPMMDWNMGYLYLIVPVSAALMFLFALRHLIEVLTGGTLPNPLASHEKSEDTSSANPAVDI
jgi:TRAP-type C4-dicarboxylate transport system permease small subunit